jgi:eukaryotic-like serine/threonine-protein kinase
MEPVAAGKQSGVDAARPTTGGGSPDPLLGQLIRARYRVVGKLATGQMGTVYVAQQVSTGNKVALKVLRAEFAKNEEFVTRFRQLMTAVRALSKNHRNIVKVYDCDRAEDGSLFVAMELLEGRILSDVILQDGRLGIERALRLAKQMAEGLGVAHELGLIHADVRPQNFMLIGKEEEIKVFGFERARLKDVAPADLLGPPGAIPRAPEYLAPEQIQGEEITKQTDIYAFGVVLYEMLTGVPPFKASTPEAVQAMHLREAPTPPKALRPEIPAVVEAKVLQALEKEPKRRENYVNDVANEYLYESALFEMAEERGRLKHGGIGWMQTAFGAGAGQIRRVFTKAEGVGPGWRPAAMHRTQTGPQANTGQAQSTAAKGDGMGTGWKLAAIGGVLILIALASLWVVSSRQPPEVVQAPAPEPKPVEVRAPEPVATEKSAGGTAQKISPPPGEISPPNIPVRETAPPEPQEQKVQPEKKRAPAPKKERVRSRQVPPTPPLAQSEAPAQKPEAQDPTAADPSAVIDWLLKRPATGKE